MIKHVLLLILGCAVADGIIIYFQNFFAGSVVGALAVFLGEICLNIFDAMQAHGDKI